MLYVTRYRASTIRGTSIEAVKLATDTPRDPHYVYECVDIPGMSTYADARPNMRDLYLRGATAYPDRAMCEAANPDIPAWAFDSIL